MLRSFAEFRSERVRREYPVEARGECGEAEAAAEILHRLGLVSAADVRRFSELADRVAAMLTGLIKRHQTESSE